MLSEYCRTTIKVCMILDKQSWSAASNPEAPQVTWGDVFSNKTIDGGHRVFNRECALGIKY